MEPKNQANLYDLSILYPVALAVLPEEFEIDLSFDLSNRQSRDACGRFQGHLCLTSIADGEFAVDADNRALSPGSLFYRVVNMKIDWHSC